MNRFSRRRRSSNVRNHFQSDWIHSSVSLACYIHLSSSSNGACANSSRSLSDKCDQSGRNHFEYKPYISHKQVIAVSSLLSRRLRRTNRILIFCRQIKLYCSPFPLEQNDAIESMHFDIKQLFKSFLKYFRRQIKLLKWKDIAICSARISIFSVCIRDICFRLLGLLFDFMPKQRRERDTRLNSVAIDHND